MQISSHSPQESSSHDERASVSQPQCPVCNASLIPLRNHYRCARCCYSICVGCEQMEYCVIPEA
jgi:hypothetical protein